MASQQDIQYVLERAAISDLKDQIKEWTEGRDSSHGYDHMKEVAEIALKLYDYENENPGSGENRMLPDRFLVEVTAWLHDVADPKYDPKRVLRRKMVSYLHDEPLLKLHISDVMWIVNNVSYSREIRLEGQNLDKHRNDSIGYARDLVSDADKSLALGKIGYQRCYEYTMNKLGYDEDSDFNKDDYQKIADHIKKHAHEKLLRLFPEGFFRTNAGKIIAEALHQELKEVLIEKEIIME